MNSTYQILRKLSLIISAILFAFTTSMVSQNTVNTAARKIAADFLSRNAAQGNLKSTVSESSLETRYVSPKQVKTPVYVFEQPGNGFAMVARSNNTYKIIGYSYSSEFDAENIPPQLESLISYYEDSLNFINPVTTETTATPVVSPLLDNYNIRLNQYRHSEVGDSWTGCVATAMTQIMLYHAAVSNTTIKGYGSHCYYYSPYGDICADFENADYSDTMLLSFHVAVSVDMQFSPDPPGSAPSPDVDIKDRIPEYFHYFVEEGLTDKFYVQNELDNSCPVYAEIPGVPVGHAVVIDGYDDQGYFHLNFGWGGSYNGYYMITNYEKVGLYDYVFSTTPYRVLVVSPHTRYVNQQDSLALIAVYNAMGGYDATGWDITKPVWNWPGVTVMNDRVIKLSIISDVPPATSQSIPDEIGNLTALRSLFLSGALNGTLPSSITNLTDLKSINIYNRPVYVNNTLYKGDLHSELPTDIDNLSKLEWMTFTNALEGTIPASIGNLTNLKYLYLMRDTADFGRGGLSGNLPPEIGNLTNLQNLVISGQQIEGAVPASIATMPAIVILDLSGNKLDGAIPAMEMPELQSLQLNNNLFTSIEDVTMNCPKLFNIELQNNLIEGSIPDSYINLSALKTLNISNNRITSFPDGTDNWINLESLYADNNLISKIPDGLAVIANLKTLTMSGNSIIYVPDNLGQTHNFVKIDISDNLITSIPVELGNCTGLTELYLNNNLLDTIPASFANLPGAVTVLLQNNELHGTIPEKLVTGSMGSNKHVRLDSNRFVFSSIPEADNLLFSLGNQKSIPLKKHIYKVQPGDTVTIDIRNITDLSHEGNEYYWLVYPEYSGSSGKDNRMEDIENNPVLKLVINENNVNEKYYCKVFNPQAPVYTTTYNGYVYTFPCLDYLNTDTISFKLVDDEELISDKYPDKHVTTLEKISGGTISDGTVTLVPPVKVKRGEVLWQASADGNSWEIVSDDMTRADLKANIVSFSEKELVLNPRTTAFYRCCIHETDCDTLFSDKLKVEAYGNVLFDDLVNVTDASKTISVDSIEVTIPQNFYDTDFRMTITKLDNPPSFPDSVYNGSVYDVTVSFADTFSVPLLIKLKNLDKSKINEYNIDNFTAVYFNDKEQQWKLFNDMHLSMKDSSMVFTTYHLTKVSAWWAREYLSGYTDYYERNNIRVYYKDSETDFMKFIYAKKQTDQPWHVTGYPLLVQDITEYLPTVMNKYKDAGLDVPEGTFNVYVKEMDDAGCVGLLGMLNGYMLISVNMSSPQELKQVLAHEFMHYTQDYYISATPGNSFWMEAHASLADRFVWNENDVPVCEAEKTLLDSRKSKNSIFNFLSNSWDYWDCTTATANLAGNIYYNYLAGTFLHYMRSYRKDTLKLLNPATLLSETTWFGSWRSYLTDYVKNHLNADLGNEYEDYVKYIISGKNKNFTVLNTKENPYAYIEKPENRNVFTYPVSYSFKDNEETTQTDNFTINVPYLAAKVILLNNLCTDTLVVVNVTREADSDTTHLVYYASYNPLSKEMDFVNITDSAEFNLILDIKKADDDENKYKNYGMLIFINKDNKNNSDFETSVELTASPVLNIENVGMLSIYSGDTPITHNFNNTQDYIPIGTENADYWQSVTRWDAAITGRSITKQLKDGHIFTVNSKYALVLDQGVITGKITIVDSTVYDQTIEYDVLTGEIKITEHESKYQKYHTYSEFVLNSDGEVTGTNVVFTGYTYNFEDKTKTYWLDNVLDYKVPESEAEPLKQSFGDNIAVFKTTNTTATKNVVAKIDAYYKTTTYNEDGSVDSVLESTYANTDYPADIWLFFVVRTKME